MTASSRLSLAESGQLAEAIDYFKDNAAKTEQDIINEIDRYLIVHFLFPNNIVPSLIYVAFNITAST